MTLEQKRAIRERVTEEAQDLVGSYDAEMRNAEDLAEIARGIANALGDPDNQIPKPTYDGEWDNEVLYEMMDYVSAALPSRFQDHCYYGIGEYSPMMTCWALGDYD
tara:strand:- start:763 stop:1080 length:318 start_codon:yes stop_codon:yes gene_type:complete